LIKTIPYRTKDLKTAMPKQLHIHVLVSVLLLAGCGDKGQSDCPDPAAQSDEYMTETEKKLARLKTGFDPNCK
jgi:predicted small lipoprotein YifL